MDDGQLLKRFEQKRDVLRAVLSGRLIWQFVRMGEPWGQAAHSSFSLTCLPVTPRMSHSVQGRLPRAAICSWMQWELSPSGSWLVSGWLSPGALRGTLQAVIGF